MDAIQTLGKMQWLCLPPPVFPCKNELFTNELCNTLLYRPKTVFEVISEMWNNRDFNPIAPSSECHTDFIDAIDCSYSNVEMLAPAAPQKIEDILVSMRSDLLRIITKWEQSGQGEGGREPDEERHQQDDEDFEDNYDTSTMPRQQARDNIGELAGCPARALQSRASFLNGRPSYLLYFWEVADAHQLLQSSLQRLNRYIKNPAPNITYCLTIETKLLLSTAEKFSRAAPCLDTILL